MEDTVIAKNIYRGRLGRIATAPPEGIYDAWDWQGEYLGGFTTVDRAKRAMQEAIEVHQALKRQYDNRSR